MKYDLKKISTRAPENWNKEETKKKTEDIVKELSELQNLLYAGGKYSVLIILQGMDASGKDGVVRKVFGTMNPQGVQVHSFKVPTAEEAAHDFLWRIHAKAPAKGGIQVFNRSQYEDVLITRVHHLCTREEALLRMKAINAFEQLLEEHNNTLILKFYLHISREEQKERLQDRIDNPDKHWKYNDGDNKEASLWDRYMQMYEEVFEHCSRVPWIIVPADQNWYKEHLIAKALRNALKALNMHYPSLPKKQKTS